jgi:rod shape-determining protein MreD
MRIVKIIVYLVAVLVLQTVILPRLNLFGVFPDLVLVSVILFAVLEPKAADGIVFSAVAGYLQDTLSTGGYFNLFSKTVVNATVNALRANFSGEETALAYGLVVGLVPLSLLVEELWLYSDVGAFHAPLLILMRMIVAVLYNLIFIPILLPIIKRVAHENQQ